MVATVITEAVNRELLAITEPSDAPANLLVPSVTIVGVVLGPRPGASRYIIGLGPGSG